MQEKTFTVTKERIAELRNNYFALDYIPLDTSPDWLCGLGHYSTDHLGILALLGPAGVSMSSPNGRRTRLKPDAPSILLAGLAEKIRKMKHHVSLGIPPIARDLSLFIACTAILAKVFEHKSSPGSQHRGVLIVSPDISIRSQYCELLVKNESLEKSFPGSRLLPNGKVQPLSKNEYNIRSGVCFFLPHRRHLPAKIAIQPDLIVLDLRYARLTPRSDDLVKWVKSLRPPSGMLAMYSAGDRQSRTSLQKEGFIDFPFDHVGIQCCENHVRHQRKDISTASLEMSLAGAMDALERKHVISQVASSSSLRNVLDKLVTLFDKNVTNSHVEINRLRWLFSIYSQMPVPLTWYENAARERGRWIPASVIKRIGSNTRDVGNLGPTLQTFGVFFNQLNLIYDQENPKAQAIRDLVSTLSPKLSDDYRLLILVRDEVMENALSSWLILSEFPGEEWHSHIDIVCCRNFIKYTPRQYTHFASSGPLHYRYRWVLGGDIGRFLHFFVYNHEIEITQKQVKQFYDHQYLDRRADRRATAICHLGYSGPKKDITETLNYPSLDITMLNIHPVGISKSSRFSKEKVSSFNALKAILNKKEDEREQEKQELDIVIDNIYEDTTEETTPEYSLSDINSFALVEDGVRCLEIRVSSQLRGLGQLWLNVDAFVEFIRPDDPDDLFRASSQELRIGDLLLIVDENQQQSIFDYLIEVADSNPKMQYIAVFRNIWRKAINLLASKFQMSNGYIDYSAMFDELNNAGIEITTLQTLQNWVNDIVIGPEDLSSIIAVGRVSGVLELSKKAKEFDHNFTKIRTLHRIIGRHVAHIIRQTFKGVVSQGEIIADESLEDHVGVPLDEIIDAIEIAEVIDISENEQRIDPYLVGRFIKME